MAKLNRREFQEMKKKALTQLRNIVQGYNIEPPVFEGECLKLYREYEQIEVYEVPQVPYKTLGGKEVVIKGRIIVTGNGIDSVSICAGDAEWLGSHINTLKEFVEMIANLKNNPGNFDKQKIMEAYFAVLDLKIYLDKLFPFTQS